MLKVNQEIGSSPEVVDDISPSRNGNPPHYGYDPLDLILRKKIQF